MRSWVAQPADLVLDDLELHRLVLQLLQLPPLKVCNSHGLNMLLLATDALLPEPDNRLTEFYDDYLDSYGDENPPPLPSGGGAAGPSPPDRIAAWARSNANPNYAPAPARSGSRSAPTSNYAPSSYGGGGSVRRKLTRRGTSSARSRIQSSYEEEEEGYVSGEYEDGPFELVKIRVKVRIPHFVLCTFSNLCICSSIMMTMSEEWHWYQRLHSTSSWRKSLPSLASDWVASL